MSEAPVPSGGKAHSAVAGCASIIAPAGIGGALYFAAGFFGPMWLWPSANQGPLTGILFTGPLGFVLGGVLGAIVSIGRLRIRIATLLGMLAGTALGWLLLDRSHSELSALFIVAGIVTFGLCGWIAAVVSRTGNGPIR